MDTGLGIKGLVMKGEEVLVLLKRNGELDLPGGRVEEGERPEESLEREIFEELSRVRVKILDPVARWSFYKNSGLLVQGETWTCCYMGGNICLSGEHSHYIWIKVGTINERNLLSMTY
jgi:8-oxo-dGTP diphosphatase